MSSEQTQNSSSGGAAARSVYFDISDHPIIWRWMLETARRDPQNYGLLIRDNTLFFRRLLGKPQWHQKKGKEWTHRWVCNGQGLIWLIQTGEAGTVFRIKSHTSLERFKSESIIAVGAIAHLKELLGRITGVQG